MIMEKDEDLLWDASRYYGKLNHVSCPAFDGELKMFNRSGFDHVIRNGRRLREINERNRRLKLIYEVKNILKNAKKFSTRSEFIYKKHESTVVYFWSFVCKTKDNIKLTIIIRQIGNNKKQFFSVF